MMIRFIWLGVLLAWASSAAGQDIRWPPALARPPASAQPDTQQAVPRVSPVGALLRSATLPGWGQFANHKFVKGTVLVVLQAGLTAGIVLERDPGRSGGLGLTPFGDRLLLALIGVRFYSMADAYVDAQFNDFDRPNDLGSRMSPHDRTVRVGIRVRWP